MQIGMPLDQHDAGRAERFCRPLTSENMIDREGSLDQQNQPRGQKIAAERLQWVDSVAKPATEIEAGTSLGTVWKARPGYASAGAAGIGISFANLRRF